MGPERMNCQEAYIRRKEKGYPSSQRETIMDKNMVHIKDWQAVEMIN
jgi:hypothetical protein